MYEACVRLVIGGRILKLTEDYRGDLEYRDLDKVNNNKTVMLHEAYVRLVSSGGPLRLVGVETASNAWETDKTRPVAPLR